MTIVVFGLKSILSIIMSIIMQTTAIGSVQVTPDAAAQTFIDGLALGDDKVVQKYVDNDYINMLENPGDGDVSAQLYKSLFKNFSYEIVDSAAKGNVAVVKIKIKTNDFSKVMDTYDKESYKYITSHLYDDSIKDKDKLSKECLNIYVDAIASSADSKETKEATIYLPLASNGHYGWEVMVSDKNIKKILGDLELPTAK